MSAVDVLAPDIDELLSMLARETLDPRFMFDEDGRPYEGAARVGIRNPEWARSHSSAVPEWIDGDLIYPDHPDAIRFFGNFLTVSHGFSIDTDDPETIQRLRAAIAANMETERFRAALARCKGAQA